MRLSDGVLTSGSNAMAHLSKHDHFGKNQTLDGVAVRASVEWEATRVLGTQAA